RSRHAAHRRRHDGAVSRTGPGLQAGVARASMGGARRGRCSDRGFLLLNNWALSVGEPGKNSSLVFTMPFRLLIFAWPLLGERIHGVRGVAVTLAAGGLLMILEPWGPRSSVLGKLRAVLAGACWALGVVISKGLHNRHPVDVFNFTFWRMALGLIPML